MFHACASRDFQTWHEEFVKKLSGEECVVNVTVNMDGIAKPREQCANDFEKVECVAGTPTGSPNKACGSTHHRFEGPVENRRLAEFDDSWNHVQMGRSSGQLKSKRTYVTTSLARG